MAMCSLTKAGSILCSGVQFWEQPCQWECRVCGVAFCIKCSCSELISTCHRAHPCATVMRSPVQELQVHLDLALLPHILVFHGLCASGWAFTTQPTGEQPEERRKKKERDALRWQPDHSCWCRLVGKLPLKAGGCVHIPQPPAFPSRGMVALPVSSCVTLASVLAFSRSRRAWPCSLGASRLAGAAGGGTGSAGLSGAQRELPVPGCVCCYVVFAERGVCD